MLSSRSTRDTEPSLSPRLHRTVLAAALASLLLVAAALPAAGQGNQGADEDPALQQTIDPDEPVVEGEATISAGHVDIGPRFVDGEWTLLARDDTVVPSVWRSLDETALRVSDAAVLEVPDDPNYDFIGVDPGTPVHVIPQIEKADVVWMGWNTQEPEVMERIDRGATLTLRNVEGPGELTMFVQSGNLGVPEVLWDSTEPGPQPMFIEVNTHAHANWVFSEPGVYLVELEFAADLVDGSRVSDTRALRLAVGDATSIDEALSASYTPSPASAGGTETAAATEEEGGSGSGLWLGALVGALALLAGLIVVQVRGGRAKRSAEAERAGGAGPTADQAAVSVSEPESSR